MRSKLARSVARFQAGLARSREPDRTGDAIFADGGVLLPQDFKRLLEPRLGPLFNIRLRPSLEGGSNTVEWQALDRRGNTVGGTLVLRAVALDDSVTFWSEFRIKGAESRRVAMVPRQLLVDRLRRVAGMSRRLLGRVRVRPDLPAQTMVAELARIVELAEKGYE
jgi:hypothetical protein